MQRLGGHWQAFNVQRELWAREKEIARLIRQAKDQVAVEEVPK